jgi:hypothetical protein
MASIDKQENGKWRARWREYPGGPGRSKSFARRIDAQRFLTKTQHDLMTGTYIDPTATRVTVTAFAATRPGGRVPPSRSPTPSTDTWFQLSATGRCRV